MSPPRLSVIVLAWNQLPLTQRCVESVRANTDVAHELVIVDNGSEPEAAAYARSAADVAVLNEENLGFAAGMNRGLAAASGDHVAFVNNDTEVPPGWASTLLDTFEDFPDAGIVLPAVTNAGNPFSVRTAAGTEQIMVPSFRNLPSGVVYVMERETADALGGWDERYSRASAEDLDLLWKVWANGLDVVLDERVLVAHVGRASVDTIEDKSALYRTNRLQFVERWTSDDPEVPYIGRIDHDDFGQRLATAATAAGWMGRAFVAEDALQDLRQEMRRLEQRHATAAPAPEPPPEPSGLRRRIASLRRRLR